MIMIFTDVGLYYSLSLGNSQEQVEDLNRVGEIADMNPSVLQRTGLEHDKLRVLTHYVKGNIQEKKNDLRNALSCYTEGIEVKCKDDNWNFKLYLKRSLIHQGLDMNPSVLQGIGVDHDTFRDIKDLVYGRN
ncbi:uncharacterized protein LOC110048534 [Orbicella faveolata]|uniref:uncharacterized protein LOC110048534 n=1 Tax=Orbicella faveolata TaxID=48498 RepID=UPI0009E65BB8|nr:uncharacterized protein LOC110048534 [Orbicella faveolata]